MSTVKTTNLQHPSAASPAIVLDADGGVTVAGMGLVLVSPTSIANSGGSASASGGAVSFTGVSSVSLNGVFTSAYENYRIVFYSEKTSNVLSQLRLRDSGGDVVGTSYVSVSWYHNASGLSAVISGSGSGSFFHLGDNVSNAGSIDIYSPNRATRTPYWGQIAEFGGTGSSPHISSGSHTSTTQFTGLTLFLPTNTMTGTIRVYGYKNS